MERGYRARAASQRLSSRPPLHRDAGAGRRLHGGGAERLPGYAAAAQEPVFFYFEDDFQRPQPFQPDVAVDITDVWEKKMDAFSAHMSQVFEWLPWVDGDVERFLRTPKSAAPGWPRASSTSRSRRRCGRPSKNGTAPSAPATCSTPKRSSYASMARGPTEQDLRALFPMLGK